MTTTTHVHANLSPDNGRESACSLFGALLSTLVVFTNAHPAKREQHAFLEAFTQLLSGGISCQLGWREAESIFLEAAMLCRMQGEAREGATTEKSGSTH